MLCGDATGRNGRKVGTGSVGTEGMGVMGGNTHRQYWDGRQCCVVMTKRKGRKVGTGSVGTEGMGAMGGDTHIQCCGGGRNECDWRRHSLTQCWDGRQCCVVMTERKGRKVGTGSVGTEGMGVMGGNTHRQCWDGRQ